MRPLPLRSRASRASSPLGALIDSGDYQQALELALREGGFDELRQRQAAARSIAALLLFEVPVALIDQADEFRHKCRIL